MAPIVTRSSKKPVSMKKRNASEFVFKSALKGPIRDLSVLRRSLLFSEISMAAYLSNEQCNLAAGKLGFTDGKCFDGGGVRAHWFQNRFDSVVVFRETEVRRWNQIAEYANAMTTLAETVGKVHSQLKTKADAIWPQVESELAKNEKSLWFCGHSLGGAMASICAWRCMLSYIKSEPEELYTFGSPRVGSQKYVNHVKLPHFRWVNNNDVVTRLPRSLLGYRHTGTEMYIDQLGRLREMRGWRGISDRLRAGGFGLRRLNTNWLSDHSSSGYVDGIFTIVRTEENKPHGRYAKPSESIGPPTTAEPATQNKGTRVREAQQQRSA